MSSTESSCLTIPKLQSKNTLQCGLSLLSGESAGERPEDGTRWPGQPGLTQTRPWGQQRGWVGTLARALVGRASNFKETSQRKFLLWLSPLFTLGSSVIFLTDPSQMRSSIFSWVKSEPWNWWSIWILCGSVVRGRPGQLTPLSRPRSGKWSQGCKLADSGWRPANPNIPLSSASV